MAQAVVAEISQADTHNEFEIGLSAHGRSGLRLATKTLDDATTPLALSADDVVVITGGARGVTAAAALALAEVFGQSGER